jgi:Ca2+-binding EF-hand superfamily protein
VKNTRKIAVALLATGFLGSGLAPAMAQSAAGDSKPAAEKRMAHAGSKYARGGHRANRGMTRAFDRYDVNKDGVITQEEVETVITERFNRYAGENGVITLDDFRAAWLENSRRSMVRAFQRLDRDGDGTVTAEERNFASDVMFNRLDRDGNGELTIPSKAAPATQGEAAPEAEGEASQAPAEQAPRMERRGPRHGSRHAMQLMERFDVNRDGRITRAEFDEIRATLFGGADADGNQSVSLEEFATIWQDTNKERIVRGFQRWCRHQGRSAPRLPPW